MVYQPNIVRHDEGGKETPMALVTKAEIDILKRALEIASVYLADCGQCPGPDGLGHHTIKKDEPDCGLNKMCKDCWSEYLTLKASPKAELNS